MKKIIILLFLCLFLVSCTNEIPTKSNENTNNISYEEKQVSVQQNHENKINMFSSKLVEDYYLHNKDDNFVFSGLSTYYLLQMLDVASDSLLSKAYEDILGNHFPNNLDLKILDKTNKKYDHNYLILNNNQYQRESTGMIINKNTVWIPNNKKINDLSLLDLINKYNADVYSLEDISLNANEYLSNLTNTLYDYNSDDSIIFSNSIFLSNVWNDVSGKIPYTDVMHSFHNSNGEDVNEKFLKLGALGRKNDFGSFTGFNVYTQDGYKIKFMLPNEGYTINDVFNAENILKANNYVYNNGRIPVGGQTYDYTTCYFPEFSVETNIDVNEFLIEKYNLDDLLVNDLFSNETLKVASKQHNSLKIDCNGINASEINYSSNDIIYGAVQCTYNYYDMFIDRPFGFIITTEDDIQIYTGVISNI